MGSTRSWQEMKVGVEDQLRRETGADFAGWNARIGDEGGLTTEAALRRWLDAQGVDGYPQMFLVYETFGYPAYFDATAEELIDAQYRDRAALRPIHDRLVTEAMGFGRVELQARKTYVTLIARRTFASIEPSSKARLTLGLRLGDDVPPAGRLEPPTSVGQSAMTHKIRLASPEEIDAEVIGWLRRAYDANA
jgi:hypothetical protein